jgi:hypothetical protein
MKELYRTKDLALAVDLLKRMKAGEFVLCKRTKDGVIFMNRSGIDEWKGKKK